ncbi:hypothetical protein FRC19_010266 [Serendipita sp. 401]|nr:hypothetical protein FRC19_010266 [Serendipita sp. 401]KAG9052686.1 hypothetical protein FS842_009406 [Serendipita sp. 407]
MRVEDLKMRVETGSYETAKKDLQALGERNALFPLWYPDGKVVPADIAKARFSMFDPNSTRGSDPQAALFMTFCQIARLARTNSGLYDVLSRFWDLPWDINFTLQIDPKYQQIIRKAAHEDVSDDDLKGLVFDPQPADEDKRLVALIERVKGQRQFRPKFTIEWSVKDLDPSRGERRIWEQHPNGIYKLWIDSRVMLSVMSQPTLGIWLNNRVLQTDEQLAVADKAIQELLKSKHTYKDATSAATTVTEVTKSKVNVVKNYKRNPDQVGAMGGLSPNDLVRKWWGMGEKELGAEWLHRSAWSYGGLASSGGFDPQSSQVMSNLIIGTHEANTMMLRYEIFVKRLAQFTGVPVRVTTTIQQLLKNELPSVGWYSPRLLYKVETPGSSNVAANFTTQFVTIDRRLPTRLELDLDELFERLVYNWGDSDFMAD